MANGHWNASRNDRSIDVPTTACTKEKPHTSRRLTTFSFDSINSLFFFSFRFHFFFDFQRKSSQKNKNETNCVPRVRIFCDKSHDGMARTSEWTRLWTTHFSIITNDSAIRPVNTRDCSRTRAHTPNSVDSIMFDFDSIWNNERKI